MCNAEAMFSKFGRIAPSVKLSVLRYFYRDLTGDATAANDMGEAEVNQRVLQFLQMEPDKPSTVTDLREVKHPERKTKYNVFWSMAKMFLSKDIGTAVDERRHSQVTHLAKAISICDFREEVEAKSVLKELQFPVIYGCGSNSGRKLQKLEPLFTT